MIAMNEIRNAIERSILDLTHKGKSARLVVDSTLDGVEIPDHVREEWGARLFIDLNPAWPLNLDFDEQAIYADLGFQGVLMRCRLPFRAVWAVMDLAKGAGFVFKEHVPPAFAKELAPALEKAPGAEPAAAPAPAPLPAPATRTEPAPPSAPKPKSGARRDASHLKLVKGGKSE
ncbi:MAG: hypothetical protein IPK07_27655 [Deltaproteobacteria bacterium]|nr:hypothetical protein [Deltaproteobacteria bacterium]